MPAYGTLIGTFSGNSASIGTSLTASTLVGSGAVVPGDLVYVVQGEQLTNTNTSVTDSQGNTYTQVTASVDSGTATARPWFFRITTAGTLTSVTSTQNGGTNNGVLAAAIIAGPFDASPLDANPANITSDILSPFSCPTTGTLAQANEVVMCFSASTGSAAFSATSPNLLAVEVATAAIMSVRIGYQAVSVTTAVIPEFTGTNPTDGCLGTASFKITRLMGQAAL